MEQKHPPLEGHHDTGNNEKAGVEIWQNDGASLPLKLSNSLLLFTRCGLLPVALAYQGCCGGRDQGEGCPLCLRTCVFLCVCRRMQSSDSLHKDANIDDVFSIRRSPRRSIYSSFCVCVRTCACVRAKTLGRWLCVGAHLTQAGENGGGISCRGNWTLLTLSFAAHLRVPLQQMHLSRRPHAYKYPSYYCRL